jgi:hypothetical protein
MLSLRSLGFVLAPLVGIGIGVAARTSAADELPAASHVTIRGTGNSISIEHSVAGAPRFLARGVAPSPILAEAADMKEAGTTDASLVGYLKAHAAELPGMIDFDTVSRLQNAGAGRTVIAYLTTVSAVEIGPLGAVGGAHHEPVEEAAPDEPYMSNELPIWDGYGGYVGYGGVVGGGGGGRLRPGHGLGHRGEMPPHVAHHVASPRVNAVMRAAPMNAPVVRPQPRFSRR